MSLPTDLCGKCARANRLGCECPFYGEALLEAMIVRGFSRARLARETGLKVYWLRRFERNEEAPGEMARAVLGGILGMPNRYFSRKPEPLPDGPIFFCSTEGYS